MIWSKSFFQLFLICAFSIFEIAIAQNLNIENNKMNLIKGGHFIAFDAPSKKFPLSEARDLTNTFKVKISVSTFHLDRFAVTNKEFLTFVTKNHEWRKSKVKRLFADAHYLEEWPSDLQLGALNPDSPVTRISWFAATAYCRAKNQSLPTTDQWEFALYDNGKNKDEVDQKILDWYGKPNESKLSAIGTTGKNYQGIYDLGALIWEWTEDFSGFLSISDTRGGGAKESNLFCGNGSQLGNPADYAAFTRYSFRASLKANYTIASLGFRCAKGNNQ